MFSQIGKFKTTRALWIIPGLAVLAPVSAAELNGQERDFLLRKPLITVSVRGGYSVPRLGGGGDTESLWDFTKQYLTVENRDFAGSYVMVELGIRGSERIDLVFALGHSPTSVLSEFRNWEGDDGLPIAQTTDFTTTTLTAGIKAYMKPRGRSIGSHVWVPRTFNPFVGMAGGRVWYSFQQYGEFVDYETLDIFREDFRSEERAPTVHFFTGMDINISKRLLLTGEARYGFAKGPFQVQDTGYSDFVGFPKLDLSGLRVSLGVGFRVQR